MLIRLLVVFVLMLWPFPLASAGDQPVILKESASGTRSLKPFAAKDRWELQWQSTEGLTVTLYTDKGEAVDVLATQNKGGAGTTFYPTGGAYFIKITARGDWTISIVQLP